MKESVVALSTHFSNQRRNLGGKVAGLKAFLLVTTQAQRGDPGQGGAMSVRPILHACIAICPTIMGNPNKKSWYMCPQFSAP